MTSNHRDLWQALIQKSDKECEEWLRTFEGRETLRKRFYESQQDHALRVARFCWRASFERTLLSTTYHSQLSNSLERAGVIAQSGDRDWNRAFRRALDQNSLCLATDYDRKAMLDYYPQGGPFQAPIQAPITEDPGWPEDTWVVWRVHPGIKDV